MLNLVCQLAPSLFQLRPANGQVILSPILCQAFIRGEQEFGNPEREYRGDIPPHIHREVINFVPKVATLPEIPYALVKPQIILEIRQRPAI